MPLEPQNSSSIVYVLTNRSMPGIVKIGWTSRTASQRRDELFTTGVPEPFEIGGAYRVLNGLEVERALHTAFRPYRTNIGREFFRVELYQVRAILQLLGDESGVSDITEAVEANPSVISGENITRRRPRPPADFHVMRIPDGAEIIYAVNGARANIFGNKKIKYEGQITSLTKATRRISPEFSGNAYKRWTFQDDVLWDIYNLYYPFS